MHLQGLCGLILQGEWEIKNNKNGHKRRIYMLENEQDDVIKDRYLDQRLF